MEAFVNIFLPVILYIVAIILLIILIIVGLRLIKILDKIDGIVDNIDEKVNTFNSIFDVMKRAADGVASISDSFVFAVTSAISKVFSKFRGNNKEEDYYE